MQREPGNTKGGRGVRLGLIIADSTPPEERYEAETPLAFSYFSSYLRQHLPECEVVYRFTMDDLLAEDPDATLNMMFHSNELAPGTSPFVRTEAEAKDFLDRVEEVCHHVASRGVEPGTLSEVAHAVAEKLGDR